MSRTHLRSHTLVLWLSLSAAVAVSALGIGCSSSSDSSTGAMEEKGGSGSGGAAAKAGSSSSDAGEPAVDGETGAAGSEDAPEEAEGGRSATGDSGGSGSGGSASGGHAEQPAEGGAGGSADAGEDEEAAAVAAAQAHALALINALPTDEKCTKCHDVTYQGSGFYPNITPDVDNGIGSWTLEDIKTAIREGKDKDQEALCMTMKRYIQFTDDELTDIAVFLKHLPPKPKKISNKCPSP